MARIQIPLDALTSRLNLGERFSSVRSQSIAARFANLKPISEFVDLKRLSKPANFSDVQTRVNYNLGYFSSNYAVVFLMLSIYSLLTNLLLLFVIILVVGGMWGIGKLEGRDVDIGVAKATSSQLYTGLLIVAVPLGIWASPISTVLWLIGATGTYRVSFFRGGGLSGRPRTPYDTPLWGRPPGARVGKKPREWEEERRVEELDSEDEDDGQGVGLDPGFQQKRFASDMLRFTGIDLSSRAQQGRHYNDEEASDYSDEHIEDEQENGKGQAMQLALRDKEDYLVQTALERIRRAEMLGKKNVRLSQDEMKALDAFERKRQQQQGGGSSSKSKEKKSGWSRPKAEEKRKSRDRASATPPKSIEPARRSRGRASGTSPDENTPPYPMLPYPDYQQPGAGPSSPPLGYYAVPAVRPSGSSSRPSSRSGSSQSLRHQQPQHSPPLPQYPYAYQQPQRYFSVPEQLQPAGRSGSGSPRTPPLPRPLPDDPTWAPRARSTSNLVPYPPDQYAYQAYAPPGAQMDPRFAMQGRRHISGPPDVHYPSMRPPHPEMYGGSSSDPYIKTQRQYSNEERNTETEDDEDDDEDNGVQVDVIERPSGSGYDTRISSGASRGGRQRKGRR